ncbi:MAG TPA: FtsX-like permease family protein [Actinoplanes sp.]|nr:FtsX-like permease family protein [Actinoplanes sp.]
MTALRRGVFELALGARMSLAGGRAGWTRLALIAAGVGIGVAVLLSVATLPTALAASSARTEARTERISGDDVPKSDGTILVGIASSQFGDDTIHGRTLQPDGSRPPLPPGVTTLPGPGEMLVSPALGDLMRENPLLAQRWDARVVGTIGEQGLYGPAELAFYLGSGTLTEESAFRVEEFGGAVQADAGTDPMSLLFPAVGMVVLLLPVMVFMASAVRFGGEARDRRLAALRLVGTDAAMTRRIAAGETLAGAVLGLIVGAALAVGIGLLTHRYATGRLSFYLADLRPVPALAGLVIVAVPATAVLVTLSAMRKVVVEPLGVVRLSGTVRRRLWWRLILPVLGVGLLWPLAGGIDDNAGGETEIQVAAGVAALLIGLALLLPWLVDAVVNRLGGGSVSWELAVRRLQLDSGTAVRAVSGIAVSVAGVIAIHGLVAGIENQVEAAGSGESGWSGFQIAPQNDLPEQTWTAALRATAGVQAVQTVRSHSAEVDGTSLSIVVADCTSLARYADMTGCTDGEVYGVDAPAGGRTYTLYNGPTWTAPAVTRQVQPLANSLGFTRSMLLITPAALNGVPVPGATDQYAVTLTGGADAVEQVRNTAARLDPQAYLLEPGNSAFAAAMRDIREGLLAGTVALLLLIGASMLVNVAEQLRERRKVLAVLVAFGIRRRTLTGSVLWQAALPVLLGMALAVGFGSGLAAVLMSAVNAPVSIDWVGIGTTSGAAVLVVLGTTVAALPTLMRLTRPGNLRNE